MPVSIIGERSMSLRALFWSGLDANFADDLLTLIRAGFSVGVRPPPPGDAPVPAVAALIRDGDNAAVRADPGVWVVWGCSNSRGRCFDLSVFSEDDFNKRFELLKELK